MISHERLTLPASHIALPQLVELKSGETYNGHLVDCDTFMNVTLRDVYLTSPDGEKFWKLKEVYIRGNVVSVEVVAITAGLARKGLSTFNLRTFPPSANTSLPPSLFSLSHARR
jgi:small nuclear ribonucleoprotein (snRNP)-like protein